MIIKDVDDISATDKLLKVGHNAEKQMAWYLKREFGESPDVLVLNGIRLESNNDSAQIDHLIIHKYGFIIIESKHIANTIGINEQGEWYQVDSKKGVPSPIKQAERQATFLKRYLSKYFPKLHKNQVGNRWVDATIEEVPANVLVAISDTSNIIRPNKNNMDNICKAESIVDKVKETINDYQDKDKFFNLKWEVLPIKLNKNTMDEIADILLKGHKPFSYHPIEKTQKVHAAPHKKFHCRECGDENINIIFGKFGYYFKCKNCNKNTPIIKENCVKCGQQLKIRKDRNQL